MSYSGITSIVDQTLGRSRIPESARPVTRPSLREPERPRRYSPPSNGRDKLIAAGDPQRWMSSAELAERAGVTVWVVYDHMPSLIDAGLFERRRPPGASGRKLEYRRVRG